MTMAKQQRQQAAEETIDETLLERVLASSEAQSIMDAKVARRVAVDAKTAVRYIPIGGTQEIEVSLEALNRYVTPTAKGRRPSRLILEEYLQTCCQLKLNPLMKDVYLVGYDTDKSESGAMWSVITSYHVLVRRAELHKEFDGFEQGIIVEDEGELKELVGAMMAPHQKLVGAWCKVFRKDRSRPIFASVSLKERDKARGEWLSQKAWMIQKCAISAALRWAFPNDCGSVMTSDEVDLDDVIDNTVQQQKEKSASRPPESHRPTTTAEALTSRRQEERDTLGKFKGELMAELRRIDSIGQLDAIRDKYMRRAGGEVDKLGFLDEQMAKVNAKFMADVAAQSDVPPVDKRPETSAEAHGDAWEGEEDIAAIEEQIARES